jgi:thiol:disulfide interchange protein
MVMKKILILTVILCLLGSFLNGQFFGDDEMVEPDIETLVQYDKGLILFKIILDNNYHITDLKHGFFKIELPKNQYVEIKEVVFPEGEPYADEIVFKGTVEVKVYMKTLLEITESVTLKFKVSYQICQEKPTELCYAPGSKDHELKINKSFKEVKVEATKERFLEDYSSQGTAYKYQPKGGNWQVLLLIAFILMFVGLMLSLSKFLSEDGLGIKFVKAVIMVMILTGVFLFFKSLDIKYFPEKYLMETEERVKPKWTYDLDEAKVTAKRENKKIMIDTYADWCVACKELEQYTFSDPEVAKVLENYILVKVDFTKIDEKNKKFASDYKVFGNPTVIFLNSQGNEERRFSGFKSKTKFLSFIDSSTSWLDQLLKKLKKELEKRSLLLFVIIFVLGFLTSLTPCVYPVIPIVMGYIGTRSGQKKLKGFFLSIFFVLGLAFVYSILGVIAGMTGSMVGDAFQKPLVVIIISAIFVLMGLSLAGLFDIPVPSSISSKVQSGGGKSEIFGSILVGGIAGIIAAPCVGPVLIALLTWISETRDILLGFLLTFIFSLGMGIIFLVVGTFSGAVSAMPKGGKWMDYVKYFFATVLIAGGIFVLNPIISIKINYLLWGIFLVCLGVFLGLFRSYQEYAFKTKLYKFILLVVFLAGVFLFFKFLEINYFIA